MDARSRRTRIGFTELPGNSPLGVSSDFAAFRFLLIRRYGRLKKWLRKIVRAASLKLVLLMRAVDRATFRTVGKRPLKRARRRYRRPPMPE